MQNAIYGLVNLRDKRIRSCVHILHDSEIIFEAYKDSDLIILGMTIRNFHLFIDDDYVANLDISVTAIHESVIGYSYCVGWIKRADVEIDQRAKYAASLAKNSILEEARQIVSDIKKQSELIQPQFKMVTNDALELLNDIKSKIKDKEPDCLKRSIVAPQEYEETVKKWENSEIILSIEKSFQRFEKEASVVPHVYSSFHRVYAHKKLANILSESELLARIISKPRGHAGDFRTIMYILKMVKTRDLTLFGELLTRWTLKQEPSVAHRNRIKHLADYLNSEIAEHSAKWPTKEITVLNLGCGPAEELKFLAETKSRLKMTLVDFDEDALEFIEGSPHIQVLRQKGVEVKTWLIDANQYKNEIRKGNIKSKFDIIYCAGLVDYCTDVSTKSLISSLAKMLNPGGVCIVTNVSKSNPYSYIMSWVLDWFLRERTPEKLRSLAPEETEYTVEEIKSESTGVNIFLLIRRKIK